MLVYDIERARVEAYRHDGKSHVENLPTDAGDYDRDLPVVDLRSGRQQVVVPVTWDGLDRANGLIFSTLPTRRPAIFPSGLHLVRA